MLRNVTIKSRLVQSAHLHDLASSVIIRPQTGQETVLGLKSVFDSALVSVNLNFVLPDSIAVLGI